MLLSLQTPALDMCSHDLHMKLFFEQLRKIQAPVKACYAAGWNVRPLRQGRPNSAELGVGQQKEGDQSSFSGQSSQQERRSKSNCHHGHSVQQEMARSFPGFFRKEVRGKKRFGPYKRPEKSLLMVFFLLDQQYERTPKGESELELTLAGLGRRSLTITENITHSEVNSCHSTDDMSELTDEIVGCGYTGKVSVDMKSNIIRAIVLHSTMRVVPMLEQLRKGLQLYDLQKVMGMHPDLCLPLFVPGEKDDR
ncbi:putative G2/M phase-specific E3 ubiquitin-protein ligase-like, partial [Triplophysa rosa]